MSKHAWKKPLKRLREHPGDRQALAELEAYLNAQKAPGIGARVGLLARIARLSLRFFLGKLLYTSIIRAWDSWSAYFYGTYKPDDGQSPWPEAESRDAFAAFAARFVRISTAGIMLALLPAALLLVQTCVMFVQVWQVQQQNKLTQQQFRVGYKSQMVGTIYDMKCHEGNDLSTCTAKNKPQMVREATLGLMVLYGLERDLEGNSVRANISSAIFEQVDFSRSSLKNAIMSGSHFRSTNFHDAKLTHTDLTGALFRNATLVGTDLQEATISGAFFEGVKLARSNLKDTKAELHHRRPTRFHVSGTIEEVAFDNAQYKNVVFEGQHISKSSFAHALLHKCNFTNATLKDVSFKHADLSHALFKNTTLEHVNLSGVKTKGAIFQDATFKNVTCPDGSNSESQGHTCTF